MRKPRPVYLNIWEMRGGFPLTFYASFMHRASGIVMFFSIPFLIYLLQYSLASEDSFNAVKELLSSVIFRLILWVILSAYTYHWVAGIKHLILDLGIGESLKGGFIASLSTFIISSLLILAEGCWLFL